MATYIIMTHSDIYVLQQYSCDGFTALPIDIQGTEYYAIGWQNDGSYAQSMIGKHQYIKAL